MVFCRVFEQLQIESRDVLELGIVLNFNHNASGAMNGYPKLLDVQSLVDQKVITL